MQKGWISLHRKITENEIWFLEPFTKAQAWIDILLNANYSKKSIQIRGNVVFIERGQLGWSELTMAKRWSWSKNKVRRFLKWLETKQQIEQQKDRFITTIITVLNYESYQNDTADDTADDTAERQQKDSRRYITNKDNKDNKDNKNIDTYVDQRGKEPDRPPDEAYEAFETRLEDNWHKLCEKNPKITDIRRIGVRKDKIKARWKEKDFREFLPEIFSKIDKSDWLTGKKSSWVITFDWLINNNKNYIKILEGQYENK